MSARAISPRLRRLLKAAASLAFLVLLAAGCSSDGFPESYDDARGENEGLVEANFMEGCEVSLAEDLAVEANSICQCTFTALSGPNGLAFEDFVKLNEKLQSNPEVLAGDEEQLEPDEQKLSELTRGCIANS